MGIPNFAPFQERQVLRPVWAKRIVRAGRWFSACNRLAYSQDQEAQSLDFRAQGASYAFLPRPASSFACVEASAGTSICVPNDFDPAIWEKRGEYSA